MHGLLLSNTCSVCTAGGGSLGAASFCWLSASLTCGQLSRRVHCSSCACGWSLSLLWRSLLIGQGHSVFALAASRD